MTLRLRRRVWAILLTVAVSLACAAQNDDGFGAPPGKLPQDTGTAALKQILRKLQTTARLMETTAHPDDEDGAMLTLEGRGKGVTVLSLTLTRGEGGQNRTGSNLFDVLGILRTLEVMASDRYYDAEQRFTHVADFGFSKTAEETLQKWNAGEPALADIVRVIRIFRPDVIVSRFQGNANDGHGNHQASGILTRQAFRAAADPKRFPEQIKEGLQPWQAKKLYVDGFRLGSDYTLSVETSTVDPVLGMSYVQLAVEGLRRQQSQGVGFRPPGAGPRISYYKLVDSVLPMPPPGTHEKDFFDGIDTSLSGLAARVGDPDVRKLLETVQAKIKAAVQASDSDDPSQASRPLLEALGLARAALQAVQRSHSAAALQDVTAIIREKQNQLQQAASLALGLELHATVAHHATQPGTEDTFVAMPGETLTFTANLTNGGGFPVQLQSLDWYTPGGWKTRPRWEVVKPGGTVSADFRFTVPNDAPYTRPYEHRNDPERDAVYVLDEPQYDTLPFPPPPFSVSAVFALPSECSGPACPAPGRLETPVELSGRPVAIGPALSVLVEPATQVIAIPARKSAEVNVRVHSNLDVPADATLRLEVPAGWRADPGAASVRFDGGKDRTVKFNLSPGALKEGAYQLKAALDYRGQRYAEGYTVVTRPDLGGFFYYQPATQHVSAVNLKTPAGLKVGYIMGAGDDIPTVLQQAGLDVHLITPDEFESGELNQYGTIVLGIRAYDVRDDVRANNKRLLDYVAAGGTLLVQYNANTTEFNSGHYTPYTAELSHDRVTVEEEPVDILMPGDTLFHFPNEITARDFDGWVQERGLYFMDNWDSHFEPLLACHDPGESPLKGGLLRARFGKGTYLYTGYAFFRQLPAGVPGAVRLFVNLVSAGHEGAASR